MQPKTLVTGWFSFEQMGATAGDLLARDIVCGWLAEAGRQYDVALAPPFEGGVAWDGVEPRDYDQLVFVCGPFGNNDVTAALLQRFAHCRKIGVDLTMLQNVDEWNPFDVLFERDSTRMARPDVTFASKEEPVPVVGLILVKPQKEYGDRGMHARAREAFQAVLAEREVATVVIDTRLDHDQVLRTPAEVESLIARTDVVLTTRLHGLVLALKNSVPVVAIDPIRGGAKLTRQGAVLGWPYVFPVEALDERRLLEAFDACLETRGRSEAWSCRGRATAAVEELHQQFVQAVGGGTPSPRAPLPLRVEE